VKYKPCFQQTRILQPLPPWWLGTMARVALLVFRSAKQPVKDSPQVRTIAERALELAGGPSLAASFCPASC